MYFSPLDQVMTKVLSLVQFKKVMTKALFLVPFKKVVTEDLTLVLLVSRIGFLIGCLFICMNLYHAFYDMFYAVVKVAWSDAGQKVERGYGIFAFSKYWKELVLGLFILFSSCLIAALVSIASKIDDKMPNKSVKQDK
ncbi:MULTISPECIES: hypothetical protein [unclassified Alteromonas]|uniref:hypothetical protein n=1 Tax=unclassified Alteromonas TaxID=2614992 RepID=UPI0012692818|nr:MULTISPECIES: hypothetical protein [unclassified Alteromonas]